MPDGAAAAAAAEGRMKRETLIPAAAIVLAWLLAAGAVAVLLWRCGG